MWQDILTAFCLMFVIEGILPFLYPNRWKNVVQRLAETDSRSMRMMGLASMLIGVLGLYLIR